MQCIQNAITKQILKNHLKGKIAFLKRVIFSNWLGKAANWIDKKMYRKRCFCCNQIKWQLIEHEKIYTLPCWVHIDVFQVSIRATTCLGQNYSKWAKISTFVRGRYSVKYKNPRLLHFCFDIKFEKRKCCKVFYFVLLVQCLFLWKNLVENVVDTEIIDFSQQ